MYPTVQQPLSSTLGHHEGITHGGREDGNGVSSVILRYQSLSMEVDGVYVQQATHTD